MDFLAVTVRHERRIRLIFDSTLAVGAFAPGLYVVSNMDGQATSPSTEAALVVASSPDVVELQMGIDLVDGAQYQVAAVGVPSSGGPVTIAPSVLPFSVSQSTTATATTEGISSYDAALYGVDILYSGGDFVEGPDGDILTVSGSRNVREALWRRALSEGLPWNNDYGLKAREFVDSSPLTLPNLRGRAHAQMLRDDRVASVTTSTSTSGPQAFLTIYPQLIGQTTVPPLQVPVTTGA